MTRDEEIRRDLDRQWDEIEGKPHSVVLGISLCACGHPALMHERTWTGRCRISVCGCNQFTATKKAT